MNEKKPRVVIIDDDEMDQELYRLAFARLDLEVELICFEDGANAAAGLLELHEAEPEQHPAVVLVDLYLPPIDGVDLLGLRRRQLRDWEVPFVMMSSSESPSDRERSRRAGCDGYIVKPNGFNSLVQVLRDEVVPFICSEDEADDAGSAPDAMGGG